MFAVHLRVVAWRTSANDKWSRLTCCNTAHGVVFQTSEQLHDQNVVLLGSTALSIVGRSSFELEAFVSDTVEGV